jgi:outer membrane protein assembly factor BamA
MNRWLLLGVVAVTTTLHAQEPTRAEEIEAEREQKQLQKEEPTRMERRLEWLRDARLLDKMSEGQHGFGMRVGGLAPGGGFGVGPQYTRRGMFGGRMNLTAGAQASMRGYQKQDLHVELPQFFHQRITVDFYAVRHNYSRLNFYGSGPESVRTGRSDYRMEDTAADVTVTLEILPKLRAGASAGYLWNNIGSGTDPRFAPAEQLYPVPGMQRQANFLRTGAFVQYDYRDFAPGPRGGGNYLAQFHHFTDRTLGTHDFHRLDLEAQQYIPLFNKRRVIALRGRSVQTFKGNAQPLPFYMQPMLGGSDDLRGYRPFRFRGDNSLVMNAEYRWEVFSGLDMALFADAGKVYMRKSQFNLDRLATDAGFGFRFNARNTTFLRIDVGFSREGYQISVKFNDLFRKGPVHTSSSQGDF